MINNIDIYEIVVSNKASLSKNGFKILIGYKGGKNVRPLCILLPGMSAYRKDFDETKYMSLLIKEYELLEKYNEIWEKVSNSMKKWFNSEPGYKEKYLKTKTKSYDRKININFHKDKMPKERSQFICLLVILIDSVYRIRKNYYPQVFLEECKYFSKDKKMPQYITVDTDISSDDSNEEISNEENSNEENYNEEN